MKVNITKAHELTGKSRTTIYKHIKSGRLSASGTKQDGYEIDVAELDRVYGLKKQFEDDTSSDVHTVQQGTSSDEQALLTKVALLTQQVEMLGEERRREREQTQEQIERLEQTLKTAQEQQTRLTALLTDQRGEKEAKAQQEQAQLIRELRVGQARLRKELQEVRQQKGFLARWLGVGGEKNKPASRPVKAPAPQEAGS